MSLSKSIFVDFDFYGGGATQAVYYVGVIGGLGVILLGLYFALQRMGRTHRLLVALSLLSVALLIIFADVTNDYVAGVINWLISLPGGWAFRSPLKWQLYVPLFISILAVMSIYYASEDKRKYLAATLVLCSLMGVSSLAPNVYRDLLKDKTLAEFYRASGEAAKRRSGHGCQRLWM